MSATTTTEKKKKQVSIEEPFDLESGGDENPASPPLSLAPPTSPPSGRHQEDEDHDSRKTSTLPRPRQYSEGIPKPQTKTSLRPTTENTVSSSPATAPVRVPSADDGIDLGDVVDSTVVAASEEHRVPHPQALDKHSSSGGLNRSLANVTNGGGRERREHRNQHPQHGRRRQYDVRGAARARSNAGSPNKSNAGVHAANIPTKRVSSIEEAFESNTDHVPDYKDYLHAQRALMSTRRHIAAGGSTRFLVPGQGHHQPHHQPHRKPSNQNDSAVIIEEENEEEQNPQGRPERSSVASTTSSSSLKARKRVSGAIAAVGNRIPHIRNSAEWDNFLAQHGELEAEDDHGHGHDVDIPFYCPPVQRQRWGDDQVLPHINWGDLFFDLFYVAAAYNLGVLLISSMNDEDWPRGVVYFIGIFGPLYNTWENDVYYSSRYTVVDHFHRFFDAIRFVLVASVVLHIKTLDFLTDTSSIETFLLMLSLCLESVLQLFRNLEVAFFADGDRKAIYDHTMRKVRNQYLPNTLVYLAAALISGLSHFDDHGSSDKSSDSAYGGDSSSSYGDKGYGDDVYGNSTYDGNSTYGNSTSGYGKDSTGGSHRFLAAATTDYVTVASKLGSDWVLADLPYILCLAIYVLGLLGTAVSETRMANDRTTDIRDRFVPNNVDYLIHRYGEWTMLMIGESILSLLIVETVEDEDYYIVALVGVLTVILIQTLKFESEPSHADGHALWRSMTASISYSILIQTLSIGLIAFGVSFKVMLSIEKAEAKSYGSDYSSGSGGCDSAYGDGKDRMLAAATVDCGGDAYGYDEDSKKRFLAALPPISEAAAASLYCWSLTIVLISLELMVTTHHNGFRSSWQFLYREQLFDENGDFAGEGKWKLKVPMLLIAMLKLGVIVFMASLSQWQYEPASVASAGFVVVTAIALTRFIGWHIVNKEEEILNFFNMMEEKTSAVSKHLSGRATTTLYGSQNSKTSPQEDVPEQREMVAGDSDDDSAILDLDKTILDSSFDAIIITDKTGIIKHVNATTLTVFGYGDSRELLGNNISMLVGGGEAGNHSSYVEAFNKSERTTTKIGKQRVLHSRRKDGTEFPCIIGIKRLPGSTDLIGYIRNTDELEKDQPTTSQLLEDPILRLVDDSSFDSIIVIDQNGIMVHVNITTVSEFGYASKQDLIGKNISILVGGGLAEKHEKFVERFHRKNKADTVIGKQRVVKSRRKDGSEFSCIIAINNIAGSECLIGYIRNIEGVSKTQKGEEVDNLLQSSVTENTDFLEDSFDSIVMINEDGVILQVNQVTVDMFCYKSKEDLFGKNISILLGGGMGDKHGMYMAQFKQGGKSNAIVGKQQIVLAHRYDGTVFPCSIGMKQTRHSTNLIGYIRDMSIFYDKHGKGNILPEGMNLPQPTS